MKTLSILLAALVLLAAPRAQDAEAEPDVWEPLRYFEGAWVGDGQGPGGANRLERTYEFVMNERYVFSQNTGTFADEVHENWDFFSYDRNRETFVLRQFHGEGYVNQYTCTISADEPRTYVFESEKIENFEEGWRARLTLTVAGPDEYTESFELAGPEQDWFQLTNGRLTRMH
jgi:hypothetical protein